MGLFDFFKTKKVIITIPYEEIHEALDIFTKESLAMPKMNNPFIVDDERIHPALFGYFMGAKNHIQKSYQLNEKDISDIYTQYLSRNFANNDMEKAVELLKYSVDISLTDDCSHCMFVGEHAMKKWSEGGPMSKYAPMGLIRLLND